MEDRLRLPRLDMRRALTGPAVEHDRLVRLVRLDDAAHDELAVPRRGAAALHDAETRQHTLVDDAVADDDVAALCAEGHVDARAVARRVPRVIQGLRARTNEADVADLLR